MLEAVSLMLAFATGIIVRGFWHSPLINECTLTTGLRWCGQHITLRVTSPTNSEAQRAMRDLLAQLMVAEVKALHIHTTEGTDGKLYH